MTESLWEFFGFFSDDFRTALSKCRPSDQANWLGLRVYLEAAVVYIRRHHLALLSLKANTQFTIAQRLK